MSDKEEDKLAQRERRVLYPTLSTTNIPGAADSVADDAAKAFRLRLRDSMKSAIVAALRAETPGTYKPVYRYLPDLSERAAQAAYDSVTTQYQEYPADRQLADAGEITREELDLLRRERAAYDQWLASNGGAASAEKQTPPEDPAEQQRWQQQRQAAQRKAAKARSARQLSAAGYALLTILVTLGLQVHIRRSHYKRRVLPVRQLVVAGILLALLAGARASFVAMSAAHVAVGLQALSAIPARHNHG